MTGARGSVLVGLLWCVALLAVIVIGVLHTARIDLMVVKNHGDVIQAHYLALAGLEKAKALLYLDAMTRKTSAQSHSGELYDAPEHFRDVPFGRGEFRVFRQGGREAAGRVIYGISDEESRLNVNTANADMLSKLYGMTPDVVASIMDWRDGDDTVTPNGAEAEYYASLQPPYLPRNARFETVRELLMVFGVSSDLLLGEDLNANGLLDPEEDDGDDSPPRDNRDGILDGGWAALLTIDSSVRNRNAALQERVNVQSADEAALSRVPGISTELAKAIVAYRNQRQLENLANLLDVTPVGQTNRQTANAPSRSQPGGPRLISQELFMDLADDVTVSSDTEQAGLININTASPAVLECLPGVERQLAEAIVAYRASAGFFPNIAWLLKVDGMTREIFQQMAPTITARSETFRILSEGTIASTGTRRRIEAVVRLRSGYIDTISYRDNL